MSVLVGLVLLAVFGALASSASAQDWARRRGKYALVGSGVLALAVFVSLELGLLWGGALILAVLYGASPRKVFPARSKSGNDADSGAATSSRMSRTEALSILGLDANATGDEIRAAYRRLIKRVHPDVLGSTHLTMQVTRAKKVLLGS